MTKQQLISWCDQQTKDGNELKLLWDGGNDSGWCHFELDGEDIENEYTGMLVEYMNDELDYGSWAGDFSATGEAIYSVEDQAFIGTDYYSETESMEYDVNIPLSVPEHLWFSSLNIHIEMNYEESPEIQAEFTIKNGFLTDEHKEIENEICDYLVGKIEQVSERFQSYTHLTVESIWDDVTLTLNDFSEQSGDRKVGYLKNIDFRYQDTNEKQIYLDLKNIPLDEDED